MHGDENYHVQQRICSSHVAVWQGGVALEAAKGRVLMLQIHYIQGPLEMQLLPGFASFVCVT